MKRSELLEVLTILKPCIKKNTLIPVLSNISFKTDTVEVFNGVQGMKLDFNSGLECAIDGTDLFKIISSFSKDEVSITHENNLLKIKCGKSVYNMATDSPSNYFPNDEEITYKNLSTDFLEGVKKCLNFASKDITKIDRCGVTVSKNNLYSTDDASLSKFSLEDDSGIEHILPEQFIKLIKSLGNEELLIGNSKHSVFVMSNKCKIFTMVNDIKLLDYENVLNRYNINELIFSKITEEFRESISRITTVLDSSNEITISSGENLLIECATPNVDIKETIDFNIGNIFISKFEVSSIKKLIENSFEIASIILEGNVILVGKDEGFLCLIASLL